jgi:hypothetical protein
MKNRADYSIRLDEAEQLYDDATLNAFQKLEDRGLGHTPRPMNTDGTYYDGHLPTNVNSFSNSELGELHGLQCKFADWVHGEFGSAKAETENSKLKLSQARAQVRKKKTGTAQEKEDLTITDARYVEAIARHLEADTYSKLVEIRAGAASRDLRVVSRLITTKELEIHMNQREGNIGRKRYNRGRDDFK